MDMKDLFEKEQSTYDNAIRYLNDMQEETSCSLEKYASLTNEYGKLLKLLRRLTKINDRVTGNLQADRLELLDKIHIDELTGLYNKRFLNENLQQIFSSVKYVNTPISILMIDVDYFKNYNDMYGHPQGDRCLKRISDVIKGTVRKAEDFVSRYGGEEFIVVMPNTDVEGATITAERILYDMVQSSIPHEDSSIADHITVSIGIATNVIVPESSYKDCIEQADKALYRSKLDGRNRYRIYKPSSKNKCDN